MASPSRIAKLDKYHLLILDDIAYVSKDQAETSVLFELIGSRYERRSMLITSNQSFGDWGKVFPDQAMLGRLDGVVTQPARRLRRLTAVRTEVTPCTSMKVRQPRARGSMQSRGSWPNSPSGD
jgi:hypothetical protein